MTGSDSPELTLTHTRLLVTEYRATFRFYRDVLGLAVEWGGEDSGYAEFTAGATTLALFDRSAMAESVGAGHKAIDTEQQDEVAIVFDVESVDEVYVRLKSETEFDTVPHDQPGWGVRVAHLRDPAGTLIEINEPIES